MLPLILRAYGWVFAAFCVFYFVVSVLRQPTQAAHPGCSAFTATFCNCK